MRGLKLGTKEFTILDSIRGIASLYVAVAHCRGSLWMGGRMFLELYPRNTWHLWEYLVFGSSMLVRVATEMVIVFFVLSGFSIAHSLSNDQSPGRFYLRRVIRIYPTYLAGLAWAGLVYLVTLYWHPHWYDGSIVNKFSLIRADEMRNYFDPVVVMKNLFYMPSNGFITPYWSLTYEVIFYLLAPFLLKRVKVYAIISLVFFLFYVIAPGQVDNLGMPFYISEFLFKYNIYFVAGVLLYYYFDPVLAVFSSIDRRIFLMMILLAAMLTFGIDYYYSVETVYSLTAAAILGALLIVYFLHYKVKISWLMAVGKYSYTLYVTHFASIFFYLGIYWLIFKPSVAYIANYFIWMPAVFFCLLIAYLQYLLVESKTKGLLTVLRKKEKAKIEQVSQV